MMLKDRSTEMGFLRYAYATKKNFFAPQGKQTRTRSKESCPNGQNALECYLSRIWYPKGHAALIGLLPHLVPSTPRAQSFQL